MSGKTGKRAKSPEPCKECGEKIVGDFHRNRGGDRHPDCWEKWYQRTKAENPKS